MVIFLIILVVIVLNFFYCRFISKILIQHFDEYEHHYGFWFMPIVGAIVMTIGLIIGINEKHDFFNNFWNRLKIKVRGNELIKWLFGIDW